MTTINVNTINTTVISNVNTINNVWTNNVQGQDRETRHEDNKL